jgi:hypothetical protein
VNVTVTQLLSIITASNMGAKMVSLMTATQPKLLAKSRANGVPTAERFPAGVERRAIGRFVLNFDYAGNVNQERLREEKPADFKAAGLWVSKTHPEGAGQAVPEWPAFMVYHVDTLKRYLRTRPYTDRHGQLRKEFDQYIDLASGQPIVGDALKDLKDNYMPAKSPAKKQDLDREIPVRCIAVENVVAACYARRWYKVHA